MKLPNKIRWNIEYWKPIIVKIIKQSVGYTLWFLGFKIKRRDHTGIYYIAFFKWQDEWMF